MVILKTIGYEAATPEDFVATLKASRVDRVLDVRAIAFSRKRDFSKGRLQRILTQNGIEYVHLPALGNPKEGREAAKAGRYEEYRRLYSAHLNTREARETLDEVVSYASASNCCLLCLERDAERCHRSMIAHVLITAYNAVVEHLVVAKSVTQGGNGTEAGRGDCSR